MVIFRVVLQNDSEHFWYLPQQYKPQMLCVHTWMNTYLVFVLKSVFNCNDVYAHLGDLWIVFIATIHSEHLG